MAVIPILIGILAGVGVLIYYSKDTNAQSIKEKNA
jgi:hypothetical protein